jgi:hypothetical protein
MLHISLQTVHKNCHQLSVSDKFRFSRQRLENLLARYGSLGFDLTPLEAGSPAVGR